MITQTLEMNREVQTASMQMIKDEHLSLLVISSQTLAGSKVQMSTYLQVVFSDCVFYGTEFQDVTFENCVFENCSFQFSHIRSCKFVNCNFTNCQWDGCSSIKSSYLDCVLDTNLTQLTEANGNERSMTPYLQLLIAC